MNEPPISRVIQKEETADGLCWVVYHAQEHRPADWPLTAPIRCVTADAWLGPGWYFWAERRFADWWGMAFKRKDGNGYDVYEAWLLLDEEDVLNTTFSEEDYVIWLKTINAAMRSIRVDGTAFQGKKRRVPLEAVMVLVQKLLKFSGYLAVVYDDQHQKADEISYLEASTGKRKSFYYEKRVQLVVFSIDAILHKFARVAENLASDSNLNSQSDEEQA